MSTDNMELLKEFDRHIEQVVFSGDCTAWNEKMFSQILDGVLFIVKRTIEPTFQIILKPTWPVNTDSDLCRFRWVESLGGFEEEVEPIFLLPSQNGFLVFFNNIEDSTRATECIKRLLDTTSETVYVSIPTITGDSGTSENNIWDQKLYLQNTRVIMAMIAVLLATIVLTVGLNPPSVINTLSTRIIFQVTFWLAGVCSLIALLLLGVVTPTSFEMQEGIFRLGFMAISIAMICIVVAFGATTISVATNLIVYIVGAFIGFIGIVFFSYLTSRSVRDFIFKVTRFRLTQHVDNSDPYRLTNLF